jgi:hypothetical protein
MHGPTCIFWANLTPLSLQTLTVLAEGAAEGAPAGAPAAGVAAAEGLTVHVGGLEGELSPGC